MSINLTFPESIQHSIFQISLNETYNTTHYASPVKNKSKK